MRFDLGALHGLTTVARTVGTHSCTGVSLRDLLNAAVGMTPNANVKNGVLGKYVAATGSDGEESLFRVSNLRQPGSLQCRACPSRSPGR